MRIEGVGSWGDVLGFRPGKKKCLYFQKNLTPPPTVSSELNLNDSVLPRRRSCTHRNSAICSLRLVLSPKLISLATADGLSYSPSNCEDTGENVIKSSSTPAREKKGRNPQMETFAGHKSSSKCSQCVLPRWGTAESCSEGFPPNQGLRGEILYLLPQNVQEVRNCFLFSLQDIRWVGYIHFHIIILQDFWVLASF